MFCVVVVAVIINAFCYHSSGYCLLPPALPTPQKRTEGSGDVTGAAEGPSSAELDVCLQSSHSKTGGLYMSNFLNERVIEQKSTSVRKCRVEEHSCEKLQRRLRKAKFSSPKPPRASGKTSGFMTFQRALVGEGAVAWPRQ